MQAFLLFKDGEPNRLGADCHQKESLLLTVPRRKGHSTPRRATQGSTEVGQEAREWKNVGKSVYCAFRGKEQVRPGEQA